MNEHDRLFDDAFVASLRRTKPGRHRPMVEAICLDAGLQRYRSQLEAWFSNLPPEVQPQFRKRLRDRSLRNSPHESAAFELLFHEYFLTRGWSPRYEPSRGGRTPDFLVHDASGEVVFCCEVLTLGKDQATREEDAFWDEIGCQLDKAFSGCPVRFTVDLISGLPSADQSEPILSRAAELADRLAASDDDNMSSDLSVGEARLRIAAWKRPANPESSALMCHGGPVTWSTIADRIRDKASDKARKYRVDIPFVIAVCNLSSAPAHEDEVLDALYGTESCSVLVNLESHEPSGPPQVHRSPDGLFSELNTETQQPRRAHVSAVIICTRSPEVHFRVWVFHPPSCSHPIPPDLFGDLRQYFCVPAGPGMLRIDQTDADEHLRLDRRLWG